MSCTPSADTATKKTRRSACCVDNPPDKYLNNPVIGDIPLVGGGTGTVAIANLGGGMQPWEGCDTTTGCTVTVPRSNCGQAYDPSNPSPQATAVPCGFLGSPSNTSGQNVFTLNPDWKAQKQCQHPGWKSVAAFPPWPGSYGILNNPGCCTPPIPEAPQSKYLSEQMNASLSCSGEAWLYALAGVATDTEHVTANASLTQATQMDIDGVGNYTNTAQVGSGFHSLSDYNAGSWGDHTTVDYSDSCGSDGWNLGDIYGAGILAHILDPSPKYLPTIGFGCGQISINWPGSGVDAGHGLVTTMQGTADEINSAGYFNFTDWAASGSYDNRPGGAYMIVKWYGQSLAVSVSDSEVTISFGGTTTMEFGYAAGVRSKSVSNYAFSYVIALSNTLSFGQVQQDAAAMAAAWNLGDDAVYPWRQDSETWLIPLVARDAANTGLAITIPPPPSPFNVNNDTNTTYPPEFPSGLYNSITTGSRTGSLSPVEVNQYTGNLIGAPQPVGNARYFNFGQSVQNLCDTRSEGGSCLYCQTGWGQLAPTVLPKTATQWTSPTDGNYIPVTGAGVVQGNNSLYLIKWAEQLVPWPSVNLARPFGRDRFVVDYSTVPASGTTNSAHNTACGGGTGGVSGAEYSSDICVDPSSYLYAYRRWPGCRAIGSSIGIVSAVQTAPGVVTITTSENHWVCAGGGYGYTDSVDFYNVPGLGKNVAVTAATPNTDTFTVAGTLTGAVAGAFVASAGVPQDLAQWDYTCPRHQFVAQTWLTTYRANGGVAYTEAQGTLAPVAGKPSVLLCSPNHESFPAGTPVYALPFGSILFESCYAGGDGINSEWNGAFLQAVPDPFWNPPTQCSASKSGTDTTLLEMQPSPCTDGPADNGQDPPTYFNYYKFHPLVEPMIQLPAGSPGLPAGVTFNRNGYTAGVFGDGTTMPALNGNAGRTNGGCQDNTGMTQTVTLNAGCMICQDWKDATHYNCGATQYPLPFASGYTPPAGAPSGTGALPGESGGGLGV